jgi:RNA polymerase sigma factor (sigma-70 family)
MEFKMTNEHIPFDMRRVRQLHNADLETVDTTPLTKEEAYGLFVQWLQLKDMAARDRIFFSMTQMVQQLAHDLEKQDKLDCELEDAISEGYLVILEKLHSWNPDIAQFSTHSYERARGAMRDLSRHERRHGLTGAHSISDAAFSVQSSHGEGWELWDFSNAVSESVDALQEYVDHFRLHEQIDQLPEREREVLRMLYFDEMTQQEVADVFKISQPRVIAIEKRAIKRLQKYFIN